MTPLHTANLAVHILAGTLALLVGILILARAKGTPSHRRWGRRFGYLTLVVVVSAAVGSVVFRFLPLFAVLNLVVVYQLVSGWRVVTTKEKGPAPVDALWTVFGIVGAILLVPVAMNSIDAAPVVLFSTLGALAALLAYDTARWIFPRSWHRSLWPYEHVYKMVSSMFAMLSALVGNVVRVGQPWSQLLPSVLGVCVIAWFFASARTRRFGETQAARSNEAVRRNEAGAKVH